MLLLSLILFRHGNKILSAKKAVCQYVRVYGFTQMNLTTKLPYAGRNTLKPYFKT